LLTVLTSAPIAERLAWLKIRPCGWEMEWARLSSLRCGEKV
jgi:hypothetical protein